MAALVAAILLAVTGPGTLLGPGEGLPNKPVLAAIAAHDERAAAVVPPLATDPLEQPATAAPSDPPASAPSSGADWDATASCEWNENPAAGPTGWATTTTGNGYYFALQFSPGTWLAYGGTQAELDQADAGGSAPSRARLIEVAERVLAGQGPGAWPNCFTWA